MGGHGPHRGIGGAGGHSGGGVGPNVNGAISQGSGAGMYALAGMATKTADAVNNITARGIKARTV